jgi:hypothetical protein
MSQRFCLFYAGYTAYAPSLYYDQLALYGQLMEAESEELKEQVAELMDGLEETKNESFTHLDTALSIAGELEISVPSKPESADDYHAWIGSFISTVDGMYPMTRIDHYYFLFGRRLAEIIANIELIKKCITLLKASERHPLLIRRTDKAIKDIEYVLFKMMAAAALLSGEHRHHYFSVFYKEISSAFTPIASIDVRTLDDNGLDKLNAGLDEYGLQVMNGFKKCIGLLKELGV